jgi:phosphatidate phosphatase APP1
MKLFLFFLLTCFLTPTAFALSKDEEVRFFPSYARWEDSRGGWQARLRGWVFEPEQDSLVRKTLSNSLTRFAPLDADRVLFHNRLQAFLVDTEEGKSLRVQWGKGPTQKIRSGEEGELRWDDFALSGPETKEGTNLPVRLREDGRTFEGRVLLIGPKGLSVVSDIDDTIKISSVTVKEELMANTFFRPWRAVPGMAALYQQWGQEGAVFHYVSNSPWPLETVLEFFLEREGFPPGTTHLRPFSARGTLEESLLKSNGHHKEDVLRSLLNDFPQRTFILVGDSGERDPEIYGAIAREFPNRVTKILIRNITTDATNRFERAFKSVDIEKWTLFQTPFEIDGSVP